MNLTFVQHKRFGSGGVAGPLRGRHKVGEGASYSFVSSQERTEALVVAAAGLGERRNWDNYMEYNSTI